MVCRLRHEFSDSGLGESAFDHGHSLIQPSVQRAQLAAVLTIPEWTAFDPLDGVHRLNDIQDGDRAGLAGQDKTTAPPGPGSNQMGTSQRLKNLGQIAHGNLRRLGNVPGTHSRIRPTGYPDNRSQSIFSSE